MGAIFGEKWGNLLPYMRILSFWFAIQFISSSLSPIYTRLEKLKVMLFFDIFHALGTAGAIWGAYYLYRDPLITLKIFVVFKVIYYLFAIALAHLLIRLHQDQ